MYIRICPNPVQESNEEIDDIIVDIDAEHNIV
jgi:Protein of unknown function (DUF2283)